VLLGTVSVGWLTSMMEKLAVRKSHSSFSNFKGWGQISHGTKMLPIVLVDNWWWRCLGVAVVEVTLLLWRGKKGGDGEALMSNWKI
jgi:hypothetical protein